MESKKLEAPDAVCLLAYQRCRERQGWSWTRSIHHQIWRRARREEIRDEFKHKSIRGSIKHIEHKGDRLAILKIQDVKRQQCWYCACVSIFYGSGIVLRVSHAVSHSVLMCVCVCVCVCVCARASVCVHSVVSDSLQPGSSIDGIFQARILGWVAISSFRGSFWSRDWTWVPCVSYIGRQILYHWARTPIIITLILQMRILRLRKVTGLPKSHSHEIAIAGIWFQTLSSPRQCCWLLWYRA